MKIRHCRRQPLAFSILVACAVAYLPAAFAQDAAAPSNHKQKTENKVTTLSQITVQAQKRVELLQDVPITMTTLPEQLLEDTGVHDIKDLQTLVPTLFVTSTTSETQTTARIRGVGTVGDNPGLESSVGIVIDGEPRARNGVAFGDLGELEEVEVLKGPQGTVFGKNTSAGLINVITRRPVFKQEGDLELTLGNYNARGISGSYNNKLSDIAAFRIYVVDRKRDGFNDVNVGTGPRTLTTMATRTSTRCAPSCCSRRRRTSTSTSLATTPSAMRTAAPASPSCAAPRRPSSTHWPAATA